MQRAKVMVEYYYIFDTVFYAKYRKWVEDRNRFFHRFIRLDDFEFSTGADQTRAISLERKMVALTGKRKVGRSRVWQAWAAIRIQCEWKRFTADKNITDLQNNVQSEERKLAVITKIKHINEMAKKSLLKAERFKDACYNEMPRQITIVDDEETEWDGSVNAIKREVKEIVSAAKMELLQEVQKVQKKGVDEMRAEMQELKQTILALKRERTNKASTLNRKTQQAREHAVVTLSDGTDGTRKAKPDPPLPRGNELESLDAGRRLYRRNTRDVSN